MNIWLAALTVVWSPILLYVVPLMLKRVDLLRPNFRGEIIPTAYGIYLLGWLFPAYLLCGLASPNPRIPQSFLLVLCGFGLLGILDDRFGNRNYSGLRGHLRALFTERIVTTGLAKAIGGVTFGFAAAYLSGVRALHVTVLCGFIISLSANAFNILDLRPGRAGAVYLLCALAAVISAPARTFGLALSMIPALIVYVQDARAKVMLGDTGSNLLGGLLGLGLILAIDSMIGRLIILTGLVTLHVLAEKVSITRIIERNPVLRRLDALTGVR